MKTILEEIHKHIREQLKKYGLMPDFISIIVMTVENAEDLEDTTYEVGEFPESTLFTFTPAKSGKEN